MSENMKLYEKLQQYQTLDYYPFHMPGHKRRNVYEDEKGAPYAYDITEIEGFDNLHHAEEIIKDSMERAAKVFRADRTYFLVNGSTSGILTAISAFMEKKDILIMARNCHKSVYNAAYLLNIEVKYVYPEYDRYLGMYGGISAEEVKQAVLEAKNEGKKIGAVLLTSPTYEGIVSDIENIAEYLHEQQIPLIVDEAHGAHFGFSPYFPESAVHRGGDVVIQSLHKTLPALTQTAVLHVKESALTKDVSLERYLGIYQTSSPSYVLMSSIDHCVEVMEKHAEELFSAYVSALDELRKKISELKYFSLYYKKDESVFYDYDKSKLVIVPDEKFFTGKKLYDILLEKYHLQMEMASEKYVIAMTSVYDTKEGFDRLHEALKDLEREIRISVKYREKYMGEAKQPYSVEKTYLSMSRAVVYKNIRDAVMEASDWIDFHMSSGKISQEFVYLYPPGVPILTPGEMITEEIIKKVDRYREEGLTVLGMKDETGKKIQVVKENWKPIQFGSF